jgi:serine/threonine protein kinase
MNKELEANTNLSHYRIVSKIGAGGMGEVYLAQDTKLDRKVALKILPADVAAHQNRMKRFVQEAKAASALNHPNIITLRGRGKPARWLCGRHRGYCGHLVVDRGYIFLR